MRKLVETLLALVLAALGSSAASAAGEPPGRAPTVLVTGANRGIGLEFARQYAERGWKVIATARDPSKATELQHLASRHPNLVLEKLDLADNAAITTFAQNYRGQPIDVLLNNAGYLGEPDKQALGKTLNYPMFEEIMRVNAYAPLFMAQAFLDNVVAGEQKKIVALTSGIGSVTLASRFGGLTFYRMSKASLDLGMRALQAEVRSKGIKVGLLVPGEVETQMLRDSGYSGRGKTPEAAARALIRVIDGLNDQDAKLLSFDGTIVPF